MHAIELQNVDKYFYLQHQRTLKEFFQAAFLRQKTLERMKALDDMTFSIERGEVVGIIGKNGAGKSTLLKLIAKVSQPTNGEVAVNGKLAPLIELGAGFHPELSGKENIFLNGIILGLSEKQVEERFDDIVTFAELEEFVDMPIKHYSSGMYVRLAFSIAVHTDPDILLVDEVLSVGDFDFQRKCMDRMRAFREKGVTIVLVSHDLDVVKSFCDRVIYIRKGKLVFDGPVEAGLEKYHAD
jgi:ABC-2 type transport system ATP-binding protein